MNELGSVNPAIFRAYDIRGKVGIDLTPAVAELIGKGYGTYMRRKGSVEMIVGHDNRPSSESLTRSLMAGMMSTGCRITYIGTSLSPIVYFTIPNTGRDGGVMVTGSHLSQEYNGFKLCEGSLTLADEEIQEIRRIVVDGDFVQGKGLVQEDRSLANTYVDALASRFRLERRLKVVIDAGNGLAGIYALPILHRMHVDVVPLYCDPDGTFPNHLPNPEDAKTLEVLAETVIREKADLGIAYDGDADRMGIIDEKANSISADRILLLLARDVLSRHPGSKVIFDVKSSQVLFDDIRLHGGVPIMWKSGHSLMKRKMKEEGAIIGGEISGHLFFAEEYYGIDDGIYASCRALEIVSKSAKSVSEIYAEIPKMVATPEIIMPCPDAEKFRVVDEVRANLQREYGHDRVINIDGARVIFEHGWALIRASNTHGALTFRFEAETSEALKAYVSAIHRELEQYAFLDLAPISVE